MTSHAYHPPADGHTWERSAVGFDPAGLAEAVRFMESHPTGWPVDLGATIAGGFFEPAPDNAIIGPVAPRGAPNGLVLRGGRIAASWGDTRRVDMTFSVAKSYLSLLCGIAVGDGLIGPLDEPVRARVDDGGFAGRNAAITWRQLLQQTSEWEGTLFGKSDRIDRNRALGQDNTGRPPRDTDRALAAPGEFWEYNDVRVNRLALALLRVFGRALPDVFRERIADPIGASATWRWEGYDTSEVEIGGRRVRSVPGGGHWGGGVFIHAEDQARIALLASRDGIWAGSRLLPEGWMAASRAPCRLNPDYGLMWWLNASRTRHPSLSASAFMALGTGGNLSVVEPDGDLVLALRWIDAAALDGFAARLRAAIVLGDAAP